MANQNKKTPKKQDTTHFKSVFYWVLHERSNIAVSLTNYQEFPEKKYFSVNCDKSKDKKLKWEHFTLLKYYIQDAPRKKQYHCSFRGATWISKINDFFTCSLGKLWQSEIKKQDLIHFLLWKCYIQDAPLKEQYRSFWRSK